MSKPRQVLPGKTYLITRRTSERRFLLKPVPEVRQVFGYLLAVASERHGVRIHAFSCLSTHFHLVVSDPEGTLPAFMHLLDGFLARALNSWWGRWESFWAPESYSRVELVEGRDVIDKIIYTLANPVSSGLVESSSVSFRQGCMTLGRRRAILLPGASERRTSHGTKRSSGYRGARGCPGAPGVVAADAHDARDPGATVALGGATGTEGRGVSRRASPRPQLRVAQGTPGHRGRW
jgi:REP element-mobilizing transposase RayT